MKAVDKYLYRHNNGMFYFRYTFPPLLTHGSFEIILSLKTKDIYRANGIILNLRIVTNRIIEGFNSETMRKKLKRLSQSDLQMIVRDYIKECLKRITVQIETGNQYYNALAEKGETAPNLKEINWMDSTAYLTPKGFKYENECVETLQNNRDENGEIRFPELNEVIDFNEDNNPVIKNPSPHDAIEWLYTKHDIASTASQGATAYKKLMRSLKATFLYLEYARYNEKLGDAESLQSYEQWCRNMEAKHSKRQEKNIVQTPALPPSKPISEVLKFYLADKKPEIKETTIQEKERHISLLIEIVGDIEINTIDMRKAENVKQTLTQFPARRKIKYPDLPIENILSLDLPESELLKPRSINKYIQDFSSFFIWAKKREYYDGNNPFSSLKIKENKSTSAIDERKPFSKNDLIKIFSSPIYQGCKGVKQTEKYKTGDIIQNKMPDFWLPLIALYSSLRRSEICSLYLKDIYQTDEGIWIFDINSNGVGKKTKTSATIRKLPIHSRLIDLGILDLMEKQRNENRERLFPTLTLDAQNSYGDAVGKRLSRFIKENLAITDEEKSFHSFRHNTTDAIREIGNCPNDIAHYITGHTFNESVQSRYGSKPTVSKVKEWMDKIEYPEIDDLLEQTKKKIEKQRQCKTTMEEYSDWVF